MRAFYRHLKHRARRTVEETTMEIAMAFEIIVFFTLTALLFTVGFASGPIVAKKFGPPPHRQRHLH